jgi:hypothetical protein
MMPLHLMNSTLGVPLTIVDDNARTPTNDLLDKSCDYRRKRQLQGPLDGMFSAPAEAVPAKPSRWDPIPIRKKSPIAAIKQMTLNDCARISLRMPARWLDDRVELKKPNQPLRRPTRSKSYADAATILEMALAEVDFSEGVDDDCSEGDLTRAATL